MKERFEGELVRKWREQRVKRILESYRLEDIKNYVNEMNAPRAVFWEVTNKCNMKCIQCYAYNKNISGTLLTRTEEANLIEDFAANSVKTVELTGGEPLLREDIFGLAQDIKDKGMRVTLATAGVEITDAIIDKLKQIGISTIYIGIDGCKPSTNDAVRGMKGHFKLVLHNIQKLMDAEIPVSLNTTVMNKNIDEVPKIFDTLIAEGIDVMKISGFNILRLKPIGRATSKLAPSPLKWQEICKWYTETILGAEYWGAPYPTGTVKTEDRRLVSQLIGGCLAGRFLIAISVTGDVFPCLFFRKKVGNIRDSSFIRIYQESQILQDLRDRSRLRGKCGTCDKREVCGGCRAQAFYEKYDHLASDSCFYNQAELK